MALSITVHGQGTFTASMEEGPVTFTAAIASVGPQGATGPTGPAGVVSATAPITYNSGTQTIGISATPTFTSVTATTGNLTTVNLTTATFADATSQTTAFVGEARIGYIIARNNTGSTIAAGKVVYLSGATGNKPTIALALATSDATSARTIGITSESIANNADGKVVISGACENIDTSAFSAGDTVYLSATTAGAMVTTMPAAPLHGVVIGIVTRANPSVGSIEVAINNYQELEELSDVSVADRANNDGLFWESSSSTWRSKTVAEVLGYTPANGADYLAKASNLSDLASASTARTNLGLGTMAVETASDYLTKAGNLSGLASASTARTNLGLGTMATETAANYALLASPALTGTPTAPTATTGTNTTQIATTAFVQQEVPAASTSTAGKVQLATNAETITGTNTTKAVTPDDLMRTLVSTGLNARFASFFAAATTGSGSTNASDWGMRCVTGTTNPSTAILRAGSNTVYPISRGKNSGVINYSKAIYISGIFNSNQYVANSTIRLSLGKNSSDGVGDLARKGIGFRISGTGAIELQVHNGTTLTNVTSSSTPSSNAAFDFLIFSDGAGNVTLYVNDSQVATTSAGPTGDSAGTEDFLQLEAAITSVSVQTLAQVANIKLHFER